MEIIVQKYGGTSVAGAESRALIASRAIKLKESGKAPVIVVSAMGRQGAPYATDTLIQTLKAAHHEPDGRELDMIMACGEIISASVIAATIQGQGYHAQALTGFQAGIITDAAHTDASVLRVETGKILKALEEGYIVVVTGFQGITEGGDITTLGRGGSDHTAAILGEALKAESVEIFTDVDGVMTADPRIVDSAKVIKEVSYEEIYQMAIDGAKVVDHKAIEVAKRSNSILKIRNTFSDAEGTVICGRSDEAKALPNYLMTAISGKKDISQVTIFDHTASEDLMIRMDEQGIEMDLINFFEDKKTFTIFSGDKQKIVAILDELNLEYSIKDNCAKVALTGHRIFSAPGVMKRVVLRLAKSGINILQTSDSNMSIWILVQEEQMQDAIKVLHDEFLDEVS